MTRRSRLLLGLSLAGLAATTVVPRAARADGATGTSDAADVGTLAEDLARLDSPFLEDRARAQAALSGRLPSGRAPLLEAFRRARGAKRAALATVLGSDDAPETLGALLDAYQTDDDLGVARALTTALVKNAEAVDALLVARPAASGGAAERLAALRGLLRRAKVERVFLSKKSRSGGTGYYHGQFDDLRGDRAFALEVLLAIVRDRPPESSGRVPGTFPTGSYRWLREPPFLFDRRELRALALNAVADLVQPDDEAVLAGLDAAYTQIAREVEDAVDRNARLAHPRDPSLVAMLERDLCDVITVALARCGVDPWPSLFEQRVRFRRRIDHDGAASLYLRMGRYAEAIEQYMTERERTGSALADYNMACAYAMWSRDVAATDRGRAARYRREALDSLTRCVDHGYEDWPWMEQDRDLDAIRDAPEYRALLARIKAGFVLPGARDAAMDR